MSKTIANIEAHDAAVAEAKSLYVTMQRRFNAKHNAWKKMPEGCEKIAFLMNLEDTRNELFCLMQAFGDIDKASATMHAAAAAGDEAGTETAQKEIVKSLDKAAEASPELEEMIEKRLKELERVVKGHTTTLTEHTSRLIDHETKHTETDKRVQKIEDYLETLHEHGLGIPEFTPYRALPTPDVQPLAEPSQPVAAVSVPTPTTPLETVSTKPSKAKRFMNAAKALVAPGPEMAPAN